MAHILNASFCELVHTCGVCHHHHYLDISSAPVTNTRALQHSIKILKTKKLKVIVIKSFKKYFFSCFLKYNKSATVHRQIFLQRVQWWMLYNEHAEQKWPLCSIVRKDEVTVLMTMGDVTGTLLHLICVHWHILLMAYYVIIWKHQHSVSIQCYCTTVACNVLWVEFTELFRSLSRPTCYFHWNCMSKNTRPTSVYIKPYTCTYMQLLSLSQSVSIKLISTF